MYKHIAVDAYIVEARGEGWQGIKVKFALTSVPEYDVQIY